MGKNRSLWRTWRRSARNIRFNVIILAVFVLLSIAALHILRVTLLQNAQKVGDSLTQAYSVEVGYSTVVYETMLALGSQYIDEQAEQNVPSKEIQRWIANFFDNMSRVLESRAVDPYAVVDGEILAANPWDGDSSFDVSQADWYQQALQADGEIIFTDAYIDVITGKPVITIAKKGARSDNVLAFDIFPENFKLHSESMALPEDSSYFLCDRAGTLLYMQSGLEEQKFPRETVQEYVDELIDDIQSGAFDGYDTFTYDMEGRQRGVYFTAMDNGWLSIITVPYRTILGDLLQVTVILSAVFLVFILITLMIGWRDIRLNQRIARTDETVRVLGNSYYALYRVDFQNERYEMIKGSDYVRGRIPPQGPYSELMRVLGEIIEPDAYGEFCKSFSVDSIRDLVARRIRDFGGDFQRMMNGQYCWFNIRVLFDESLAPGEVVLCFREVEKEKQQQLQHRRLLEDALESTQRSEKAKNAFFSNMSHDMRTPLNAIIGLADLAGQYLQEPEKLAGYLDKISLSSKQLLNLINDILEMSRLEQGKITFSDEEFDLCAFIEDCAGIFRTQAETERKDFAVSLQVQEPVVWGDPLRIGQILNNLLSNAFKFSKAGAKIDISVKQFDSGERAKYQIAVRDTGAGMSAEFVEQIFEPYTRETRFGAKNVSGTGLGMPIVKSLVQQMNGQITVESELGKGSVFTITLPLQAAGGQVQKQEERQNAAPKARLAGKRVLLAEDNEINMEIALELLTMHGMEVTQAWNGREAVEAFQASAPFAFDAILMDMQMPEMDGCEAAKRIRAMDRPDAARVPILAVTANAFSEDIARTTEAGMNAHISKPIDFNILYETLGELMGSGG